MLEIDYNALLVDISDSIGVVCDAETKKLLYMNNAALRTYGLPDHKSYQGKTCYEVMCGQQGPCPFCPEKTMIVGEPYRWEQYNETKNVWLDHTDYLFQTGDRTLLVKIARNISARKAETSVIPSNLTMEDTLFRCLKIFSKEKDLEVAVQLFLKAIAGYYQADRAYIFELDIPSQTINNTYEWCNDGVPAEIDHLQNLPIDIVKDWITKFETTGEFSIISRDSELNHSAEDYQILKTQNVNSLMAAPFFNEGTVIGFLGVDNPRRQNGNLLLLRAVSDFIVAEIEKRQMLDDLEHLCYTDTLTGVCNRLQFDRYLKRYDTKTPPRLGVISVNVNGMKKINEMYGTKYGDDIICQTCNKILDAVCGQVFRISGDEFIALCDDVERDLFQAMVSKLRDSFPDEENSSVSIGCAWAKEDVNVHALLKQASDLMYAEKRNYYSDILKKGHHAEYRGPSEDVLREIQEDRFVAYFQPQVNLRTGQIVGAEALVRKIGDDGNLIFPDKFIGFYEKAGIIRYVDLHMLDLACIAINMWKDQGFDLRVSVNFSRQTLMEPGIVDEISRTCARHHVLPSYITVEVTESINKIDSIYLEKLMLGLRVAGFSISLDDFGSSYSNLSILSEMDFHEIKYDRSLVQGLETNKKSQTIMRNCICLCNELECSLSVAEGIETVKQMTFLRDYGCDVGQGYLFSKPISQEAFLALLKTEKNFSTISMS